MTWQPIFPKISITSVVYLLSKTYFNNGFSCQHNIVFVVEHILPYLNTIFRSFTIISAICVDYSWKKDLWIMRSIVRSSVVTILEFLTSIRYLEKYRYSIPFSIPGREKNCHNIKGSIIIIFFDKYNMTMRYILHEQKCLEVVHLFKV